MGTIAKDVSVGDINIVMRSTSRGIATCATHAHLALLDMDGDIVRIKSVRTDQLFSCQCGEQALYFLAGVAPTMEPKMNP